MIASFRRTPTWLGLPALGLLATIAIATLTVAVTKPADPVHAATLAAAAAQPDTESPADRAVIDKLEENLKVMNADQQGLEKIISFLRDNSGCNFLVKWKALESAGIDRNTPVTVQLVNVPYRKALKVVLEDVGNGVLSYIVDEGVVTISTRDDLNSAAYLVMRVYNVRDLLAAPAGHVAASVPGEANAPARAAPAHGEDDVGKLISLLEANASPDTWRDLGGATGSIQEFKGLLTVTTTPEIHRQISAILQSLRVADKTDLK